MENQPTTPPAAVTPRHNAGLDALRASMTLLVIWHHCAITYGAIGGWYYHEIPTDKSLASIILVLFCTVNQAFFMGLFFLLAGYFTPAALARKGPMRFLLDRLIRLGLPLLFYGWVLGPVTIALARTSQGRPFFHTLLYLWRQGTFENGPLWFAQALLIFTLLSVLWFLVASRHANNTATIAPRPLPSDMTLVVAAVVTGIVALALRSVWPVGVNVWGLQLAYFASYVVLFVTGCLAARPAWLEHLPATRVRTWRWVSLIVLPVLPSMYFLGQVVPELRGRALSVAYAFWEPLLAWGAILFLLDWFQRHLSQPGALWRSLGRRAYAIYIVHPPVLVAVALAWRHVPANALLKFALTGSVTCVLCFVLAGWLLRWPRLRTVL